MKTKYLIPLFLFFTFSIAVSAASFEEGREAYLAKDYEKALSILEPLAKKGNAKAQVTLGIMYDFGHGVKKDPVKAVEWYEKAAAQGNSSVQHDLGVKYFKGQGIPQNYDKAAAWWRMAAENGVAESQYNLGLMYARGLGFKKDSSKAVYWYSKAAAQGNANAQYSLGVMYSFGQGVPQNYEKSIAYFRDAAEQDIAQAQYNLAVLLENGRGSDVDWEGAKKWYQRASAGGIEQATERLASLNNAQNRPVRTSNKIVSETTNATQTNKPEITTPSSNKEVEVATTETANDRVFTNPETVPIPAKMENLTIPETEITQTYDKIPEKTPPENHQVVSGTVIEQATVAQKVEKTEPIPEKTSAPIKSATQKFKAQEPVSPDPTEDYSGNMHDEDWIRSQDPQHYTLQMIAFSKKENALRYMENLDLEGDKAVYKATMYGKTIYKVIYGNFENHRASLKGRRALPKKYRDGKPFPRSFEFLQNDVQE